MIHDREGEMDGIKEKEKEEEEEEEGKKGRYGKGK